ncbi:MAG: hypothetical protein MPK03_04085, partial [Alphaproteobacteria bacterium]|nr:hypothetical protein [Alphaproteobacteria bacterium]
CQRRDCLGQSPINARGGASLSLNSQLIFTLFFCGLARTRPLAPLAYANTVTVSVNLPLMPEAVLRLSLKSRKTRQGQCIPWNKLQPPTN